MAKESLQPNFTQDKLQGAENTFANQKLYWGWPLHRAVIYLKRSRKKINKVVLFFCYLLVLTGWAALIWWFYMQFSLKETPGILETLMFWQHKSWLILVFLVSLFFDLFLIYRLNEQKAKKVRIKYPRNQQEAQITPIPRKQGSGGSFDVAKSFSDETLNIIEDAYLLSKKLNQPEMTVRHIFWALLSDPIVRGLFIRLDVDGQKLIDKLKKYLVSDEKKSDGKGLIWSVEKLFIKAYIDAYQYKQEAVESFNLLALCLEHDRLLEEILYEFEVDQSKINNVVHWHRVDQQSLENRKSFSKLAQLKPGSGMNKSYTAVATPTLNQFSHDLTLKAKYNQFDICVGRDKEISAIFQAWQTGQAGVLLVGNPGVGKRTVVEGLAQLMVREEVPRFLKDKRLVELDVSRLVSGADASQAQERLLNCLHEVNRARNIILFVENIENLSGISAGKEESLELSEVLSDALSRRALFFVSTVSKQNYSRFIENSALGQEATTVGIKEPEIDQAIQMVESKISALEGHYGIYFSYSAISKAVIMTDRYIQGKFLPSKAIDLIQATAVRVHQRCQRDSKQCICSKQDVAKVISEKTGIPADKISEDESYKLLHLEEYIHERLIDQVEAVSAVAASLRRARAEVRDSSRPIANFLFLGPTGVGKTELAKSVADVYFGDEKYMVRLDMSEYQHPDSVKKMIGDVDGVLGYLTEAVRKKPFSLILLDEIEKAHPDILNLFLQMMDDGRLTDGQGRTINFSSSIIIATSNAGSLYIQKAVKEKVELPIIRQALIDEHLNQVMRPELINRFDGIIVFKPLSQNDIIEITKLMLKKIGKRLKLKGIFIDYTEEGVKILATQGYDPKFGARPLRRLLQDKIENEVANLILAGKIRRRDTLFIDKKANLKVEKGKDL